MIINGSDDGGGMETTFRESRPILPRKLFMILALVLVATVAFMAIMRYLMRTDMPDWSLPVTIALFAILLVACAVPKLTVECFPDRISITYFFRKTEIPFDQIIDKKCGDTNQIRNYGSWNIKGVKHKFYSVIGDDMGVAMKLMGKKVVVVSTERMDELFNLIPVSKE